MKFNVSEKEIKELQFKFKNKDIIIIDESSFIGIKSICILDHVLRKVRDPNIVFGSFKIIFLGDYQQLSCVKDFDIYQPSTADKIAKILKSANDELPEDEVYNENNNDDNNDDNNNELNDNQRDNI